MIVSKTWTKMRRCATFDEFDELTFVRSYFGANRFASAAPAKMSGLRVKPARFGDRIGYRIA